MRKKLKKNKKETKKARYGKLSNKIINLRIIKHKRRKKQKKDRF